MARNRWPACFGTGGRHGPEYAIPLVIFVAKEIAGEIFEQKTGLPAPTVKGLGGKATAKEILKSTRSLRGRKSFTEATQTNKSANGGKCEFCSENEATQGDHIRPLNEFKKDVNSGTMTKQQAKDAANEVDNNAASCAQCNLDKGTKPLGDGPGEFKPSNPSDRINEMLEKQ